MYQKGNCHLPKFGYLYSKNMCEQLRNISLKSYNTFGIEVHAHSLNQVSSPKGLCEVVKKIQSDGIPMLVLGGGSNILFTKDYDGAIVRPLVLGIEIIHEDAEWVTIRVGAGVEWDTLVEYAVVRGWGGLENLSLIPGSVGASPIQNIGAYGAEAGNSISRVSYFNIESLTHEGIDGNQCRFGYRTSIFKTELKGRVVITHVDFRLSKNPKLSTHYGSIEEELSKLGGASLANVRRAVISIRSSKLPDPKELGNAGSFFKNPVVSVDKLNAIRRNNPQVPSFPIDGSWAKVPAGWLIEQCGWKGKKRGNAGVHSQQALVLVNHGGATGIQVLELASAIQESVVNRFGIELELEVNVV